MKLVALFPYRPTQGNSLVAVPFWREDPELVLANLGIAAAHPAVAHVLAVAGDDEPTNRTIVQGAKQLGRRVQVIGQERHGRLRPGKGDAVNTAFRFFLEETSLERIHFYDADIKTFSADWISKAEEALDMGYDAVRHYYPRAATDAMITWMVTRPGFALRWPESELPWIEQPLSGELAFTRAGAKTIAGNELVVAQSDWGIDTVISFATISGGLSIYESYISRGKDHALYNSLADLRVMMVECLAAIQRIGHAPSPQTVIHRIEYPHSVSPAIAEKAAYDIEASQRLLAEGWTEGEERILDSKFPAEVATGALNWKNRPDTTFMTEATWLQTLSVLLKSFDFNDEDWRNAAFRLWLGRVLHYTLRIAVRGHSYSMAYLHDMVRRSVQFSLERF